MDQNRPPRPLHFVARHFFSPHHAPLETQRKRLTTIYLYANIRYVSSADTLPHPPRQSNSFAPMRLQPLSSLFASPSLCFQQLAASFRKTPGVGGTPTLPRHAWLPPDLLPRRPFTPSSGRSLSLSSLECADPQNVPATPLESADPKYRGEGVGVGFSLGHSDLQRFGSVVVTGAGEFADDVAYEGFGVAE
jgi:hypothetical protein